ncbi:hypothetical protein HPP92_022962 [Vanilla planifolia]|uniref:Uncharacterized protein n=1 Tax=Vanilla planifolia TaxID=51239 RepID=A0A835PPI0_VANPL|nr:hypothetical protein HPP92_022962 [Vanilla planifolia]
MSAGFHRSIREEDEEDLGEDSDEPISPSSKPATQPPSPVSLSDCNRGLSNYYKGKSQSFTTLSEVKSLGDLPKKEKGIPEAKKTKTCRGYDVSWAVDIRNERSQPWRYFFHLFSTTSVGVGVGVGTASASASADNSSVNGPFEIVFLNLAILRPRHSPKPRTQLPIHKPRVRPNCHPNPGPQKYAAERSRCFPVHHHRWDAFFNRPLDNTWRRSRDNDQRPFHGLDRNPSWGRPRARLEKLQSLCR